MSETVYSILVINQGVLEHSAVFRDEPAAEAHILSYMKNEYAELVEDTTSSYEELVELLEDHDDLDVHFIYEPVL
jgi:hypothetical protein